MAQPDPVSISALSVAPPARRAGFLSLALVAAGAGLYGAVVATGLGGGAGLALALAAPLGVAASHFGARAALPLGLLAVPLSAALGLWLGRGPAPWLVGSHLALLCVVAALGRLRDLDVAVAWERDEALRLRRQLAQRRAQTEALLGASDDAIFVLDVTGGSSRFGGDPARPGSAALEDAVPHAVVSAVQEAARKARSSGQPVELPLTVRDGGRGRDYVAHLRPGHSGDVVVVLSDTSACRRLERELSGAQEAALEAARLKTKFLANMSHEIRTPMNGVIGMTNLLRETRLSREQGEYVEIIYKSGNALLEIIDDILDFAKIEAGKMELDALEFDPRACVYESVDAVAHLAFAKSLEFGTLVGAGVPPLVVGDPNRLRQILANLLSNAVRYTDRGSVSASVQLASRRGGAQVLRFSVRDTGRGVDPALEDELFQPLLFEDDRGQRDPRHGKGLGLAIARQLVGLMGGEIGVEREAAGTVFWFTARFGEPRAQPSIDEALPVDLRGVRVLLVEGAAGRRLLAELLRGFGAAPEAARRRDAVPRLRAAEAEGAPFAAVIVDLPRDPEGVLGVVESIRGERSLRELPLLAVDEPEASSSLVREELRRKVGRLLSWPLRHDELRVALTAALARAREEPRRRRSQSVEVPLESEALMFGVRVLVAEDNPVNQRVAERSLQLLGCEIELAPDGRTAVQMALGGHFDAVLMDCEMPELDGLEATRAIRATDKGAHLPIIAMTAHNDARLRDRCLEAGMNDFICKPVAVPDLQAALQRWITDEVVPASASHPVADQPQSEMDVPVGEPLEAEALRKLDELGDGDPGFVRGLIEMFLDQAPRNLAAMQAALSVQDTAAIAKTAHTMKSGAAYLGAVRLADLCKLVETKARDGEGAAVQRGVAALHAEYERVQRALERLS